MKKLSYEAEKHVAKIVVELLKDFENVTVRKNDVGEFVSYIVYNNTDSFENFINFGCTYEYMNSVDSISTVVFSIKNCYNEQLQLD